MLAVLTLVAPVFAQSTLYTYHGVNSVDKFGYNVTTIGDIDGDGRSDFIYSSPFMDTNGKTNNGIVRVHSGATGAMVYEFHGPLQGDEYGYAVDGAGDIDGDGVPDFLITRLVQANRYTGEASVHSGATGAVIHTVVGAQSYDYFGVSGAGVGDVNGDGFDDFAVGAPGRDDNGSSSGEVTVYSGLDATILFSWDGDNGGDQYGWWIAPAGDADHDGFADIVIGAPTVDLPGRADCGMVEIRSGKLGTVLHRVYGDAFGDRLGWCVSAAGDIDHDGHGDFFAGAYLADPNGANSGMARVYSGRDASTLFTFHGDASGDEFGWSVRNAGDVDGDGYEDLLVGARFNDQNGANAGLARLFSGANGSVIHTFLGTDAGDQMGYSVGGAGDVNADGYAEVILGAAFDSSLGPDAGTVSVVTFGGAGTPPRAVLLDSGCRCSNGKLPRIAIEGRSGLGDTYTVRLRGGLSNAIAFVNLGILWNQPLGALAPGCTAVPYPLNFVPTLTDVDGLAAVVPFVAIPIDNTLIGVELFHQWFVLDPSLNNLGLATSNALAVTLGM
jgi:hypothetical protein